MKQKTNKLTQTHRIQLHQLVKSARMFCTCGIVMSYFRVDSGHIDMFSFVPANYINYSALDYFSFDSKEHAIDSVSAMGKKTKNEEKR